MDFCTVCVNQITDVELEVDCMASPQTLSEIVALPSTDPVTGESFCQCDRQEQLLPGFSPISDCLCGEEDEGEQQLMNSVIPYRITTGCTDSVKMQ